MINKAKIDKESIQRFVEKFFSTESLTEFCASVTKESCPFNEEVGKIIEPILMARLVTMIDPGVDPLSHLFTFAAFFFQVGREYQEAIHDGVEIERMFK